jgi:hypothetical protein
MKCLHRKLKLTGEIITGRYEKRDMPDDKNAGPFYCEGEKAVCKCGAMFIIPINRWLRIVEIEKKSSRVKHG